MCQTVPGSFPQNLPFEPSKDGQQASHRATGRRGQVQRLGQGYEPDAEMLEGCFGADWGVCMNNRSSRAGLLTVEHQGCPDFEAGIDPDDANEA